MEMDVKLCTFKKTQKQYACQPVFRCRTCQLVGNLGMCYVCAAKCHQGHDTFYHYYGGFFCDCGEKGSSFCNALVTSTPCETDNKVTPIILKDSSTNKIFECPICLNYMCTHIYMCVRGHNVCGECKSKITSCPICRGSLAGARNLGMETLGQSLEIPCDDCNENVRLSALNNHKKVCVMNGYKCPLSSDCDWVGKMWDIYDHCLDQHEDQVLSGSCHEFQHTNFASKSDSEVSIIAVSGSLFLFHRKFNKEKDSFQCVVRHLSLQDEGNMIGYTIEFSAPDSGESIILKKNVRPMCEEVDDIYNLHQGVTLYMSQAINIVQIDSLNYILNIEIQ